MNTDFPFCSCLRHTGLPAPSPTLGKAWQEFSGSNSVTTPSSLLETLRQENMELSNLSAEFGRAFCRELASKCFPQITPFTPIVTLPEIDGKSDAFAEIPVITHAFQSIFDGTTTCINRTLMETFDALEALIRKSAVDEKELKLALRFRVIRDMADIWKPRTNLWWLIESHYHHEIFSTTQDEKPTPEGCKPKAGAQDRYGLPAERLAFFAGVLFACDILRLQDLITCISLIHSSLNTPAIRIAIRCLYILVWAAGDKVCKSRNQDFMRKVESDLRGLSTRNGIKNDKETKTYILQTCSLIWSYIDIQFKKRENETKKSPMRQKRPQRYQIGSIGYNKMIGS